MKIKIVISIIALSLFSSLALAQRVVITDKKITYTRPKPTRDYKKTFTVNYPKVQASTPALSKRIEAAISYESVFPYYKLKEELKQSEWVDSADYEVVYNKNGILSISAFMEGSGAYPSEDTKYVTLDLRSGMSVKPSGAFANLQGLLKLVRKAKDREVAQAKIELKKDPENSEIDQVFSESAKYHPARLDQFSVSDKGVTFHHDYEFAHVIEALQPNGEFFFTWEQLKPYIKRGGLLSRIAH